MPEPARALALQWGYLLAGVVLGLAALGVHAFVKELSDAVLLAPLTFLGMQIGAMMKKGK